MHAFDVLGDPVRRRIVELLSGSVLSAGEVTETVVAEFGISQPAVSNHLRVLREAGFASSESSGSRRLYRLKAERMQEVTDWADRYGRFWSQRLDALDTETRRGRRDAGKDRP